MENLNSPIGFEKRPIVHKYANPNEPHTIVYMIQYQTNTILKFIFRKIKKLNGQYSQSGIGITTCEIGEDRVKSSFAEQ
jgi:hypothetical protein